MDGEQVRSARMLGCGSARIRSIRWIQSSRCSSTTIPMRICPFSTGLPARRHPAFINSAASLASRTSSTALVAQILATSGHGPDGCGSRPVARHGGRHRLYVGSMPRRIRRHGDKTPSVDGVAKLSQMEYGDSRPRPKPSTKMVVAMSRDVRTLLVKLADRVHNARTGVTSRPRRTRKGVKRWMCTHLGQPTSVRTPSRRVGIGRTELRSVYPKIYNREIVVLRAVRARTARRVPEADSRRDQRGSRRSRTSKELQRILTPEGTLLHLPEDDRGHMISREHLRLVGVRIIVDTIQDCYAALGAVHARWNPVRPFQDYIAIPKLNMYQTCTTVVGPVASRWKFRFALGHAPPRGIRHRCALEVQGERPAGRALELADKSDRKRGETRARRFDNLKWIVQLADWTRDPDSVTNSLAPKKIWARP